MAIELASQYLEATDELFFTESRKAILTNQDFSWTGAHEIKVYSVTTADMEDYGRSGPETGNWSRYGAIQGLDATTQAMTLTNDRSFTFAIDRLDEDETKRQLEASSALARQLRQVTIPEVDSYVYATMCTGAGTKPAAKALTADNIYDEIITASKTLDNAEVPENDRKLVVTPDIYVLLKKSPDIHLDSDIAENLRLNGVIATVDGCPVIKVPANRVPDDFGFMMAHPVATVAPTKLASYKIHEDPPGISGALVEGRIVYDAFILENKKMALYYQAVE